MKDSGTFYESPVAPGVMHNREASALIYELKVTLDRVGAKIDLGKPSDQEDLVVLRGNVERIVEMAEAARPKMFDLSTIRVSDTRWEANEKTQTGDSDLRCVVCNRAIDPDAKGAVWVHMSEQWNVYPRGTSEETARTTEGDMYYHPVGANCARKIPAAYK